MLGGTGFWDQNDASALRLVTCSLPTFYLHFQHPLFWDLNDSSDPNEGVNTEAE